MQPAPFQTALRRLLTLVALLLVYPSASQAETVLGCTTAPCLTPNLLQAESLFTQIEQRYPQLFSAGSNTQVESIDNDTAQYRQYNNSGTTVGIGTYRGSLWYTLGGAWTIFSSLDDGNRLFCDSRCWNSNAPLKLSSATAKDGGTLPADFTCDGTGSSLDLSWENIPAGTKEFALLMTTLPGDGTTKWNWVLYNIPGTQTQLSKNSSGIGTLGVGSDGPTAAYQPPCSQGPDAKLYTFTLYALSATPSFTVAANKVTGAMVTAAIAKITLGSATLNLSYTRPTIITPSNNNCSNIQNSLKSSTTGDATATCDTQYAYISSNGLATHAMMNGITATNLQVPIAQNFTGANAWKIPLNPSIAANTTTAVDGPIGVAVNGVPIFNPCKQGGCQNGDTKVLGELDNCNGHAGRADDYHYHAAPTCLMAGKAANYWDTHPVGWALDGYAIFGYHNADGSTASRDSICGGNTSPTVNAPTGYSYHVTDASPYVLSCFRGTPSPDLANQASKYSPLRKPPVTPFQVSGMSLSTDPADGYQVLQFSTSKAFSSTETGSDNYNNPAGTYKIRYKAITGAELSGLLVQPQYKGKSACWLFQFTQANGQSSQPSIAYCR